MKWNKRSQNVLFVEDEKKYNWASARPVINRRLIYLCLLFILAAILFSALR
tara:strand:+ start:451 stop:603 length:153 start_codon:yes stop_codon:yes gene_type:complete